MALFDLDRRTSGDGKPGIIYVRDKRHQDKGPKPALVNPAGGAGDSPTEETLDEAGLNQTT